MRRIFVPLQGPDDASSLLPLAGDLAVQFGAQVEAALVTNAAVTDEEAAGRAVQAAGVRAIFTSWSETHGARIAAGWREIPEGVVYAAASLGRASDLSITQASGDRRFRDALLASGRLTLLAPARPRPPLALLDHVVVAWDGSAGSAHALGQSLALLARARSVQIVIIGRNTVGARAREAILSYVLLHNGHTRLAVHDNAHRQTGRVLLDALRDGAASLVVMGVRGRSHSSATQPLGTAAGEGGTILEGTILGGAILKVIEDGRIPILTAS
jgi:hypothetical protein